HLHAVDPLIAGLKLPDGDERARLAWEAAAELERLFRALIIEYDWLENGTDPRGIPPAVLQCVSRRGLDLAHVVLTAIGDGSTSTQWLDETLGPGNRMIDKREAAK